MSEFFDYDKDKGIWYTTDWDDVEGKLYIHAKQDVEPLLNLTKSIKNSGENDKATDWMLYAKIPPGVEMEIKKKYGFSIYDKNATKKLFQVINSDYPDLRCGGLKHE